MQNLLDALSSRWRYLGPIRLIAGTDLAEANLEPHEFYEFISGRLSRQFIKDAGDIDARLGENGPRVDPDGRFRVEDFFCHDDTWRATVSRLMRESDVVLMDLRGLSAANRGAIFEIGLLVHTIPIDRVVFLADESTDMSLLERSARTAWASLPTGSPNTGSPRPRLRVFLADSARRVLGALIGVVASRPDGSTTAECAVS